MEVRYVRPAPGAEPRGDGRRFWAAGEAPGASGDGAGAETGGSGALKGAWGGSGGIARRAGPTENIPPGSVTESEPRAAPAEYGVAIGAFSEDDLAPARRLGLPFWGRSPIAVDPIPSRRRVLLKIRAHGPALDRARAVAIARDADPAPAQKHRDQAVTSREAPGD